MLCVDFGLECFDIARSQNVTDFRERLVKFVNNLLKICEFVVVFVSYSCTAIVLVYFELFFTPDGLHRPEFDGQLIFLLGRGSDVHNLLLLVCNIEINQCFQNPLLFFKSKVFRHT